jgi:heterodisulfide reductase subunit A
MSEQQIKAGVFITGSDGNRITEEQSQEIAKRLEFGGLISKGDLHYQPETTLADITPLAKVLKKKGYKKALIVGFSPAKSAKAREEAAEAAGIASGNLLPLEVRSLGKSEKALDKIIERCKQALHVLEEIPIFEIDSADINQSVLVIGGGIGGVQTAAALNSYGYKTTLVEKKDRLGGELTETLTEFSSDADRSSMAEFSKDLESIEVFTESTLDHLEGRPGDFKADILTPSGKRTIDCGAVVLAPGIVANDRWFEDQAAGGARENSSLILPVEQAGEKAAELGKKRVARNIGIVLDLFLDETKASTEMALSMARKMQEQELFQVHLFVRDVRVASLDLEKFYDLVRDEGVDIVKYDTISFQENGDKVAVSCTDTVLQTPLVAQCDFLAVSRYGLEAKVDPGLAETAGVSLDETGLMQENNIHLFPGETNREGVYVVGSARGTFYIPDIIQEAKAVAETVDSFLSPKTMRVEDSSAVVDPDKCVLCLTCVRSCPYKAMYVDHTKGAAASMPEACKRCGICAGECPAKAIHLPAYSDSIMTARMGR